MKTDEERNPRLTQLTQRIKAASFEEARDLIFNYGYICFKSGLKIGRDECKAKTNSSE